MVDLEALDVAASQFDRGLQVRQEAGEVRALARIRPRVLGDRARAGHLRRQLHRYSTRLLPVAAGNPDEARLEGVLGRPIDAGRGRVDQPAELVGDRSLVCDAGQGAELLGARAGPSRRHLRALVPGEQRGGAREVGDLAKRLEECLDRCLHPRHASTRRELRGKSSVAPNRGP
jgi:hypothetical protein